jgi:hypothetical protein
MSDKIQEQLNLNMERAYYKGMLEGFNKVMDELESLKVDDDILTDIDNYVIVPQMYYVDLNMMKLEEFRND